MAMLHGMVYSMFSVCITIISLFLLYHYRLPIKVVFVPFRLESTTKKDFHSPRANGTKIFVLYAMMYDEKQ